MNPDQYERVSELFAAARRLAPAERDAYLQAQAGKDPSLLRQVQGMLAEHQRAETPLDAPGLGVVDLEGLLTNRGPEDHSLIGTRLGAFRLTGVLASGGMGTVFTAEQEHPQRTVAVKVMRRGLATDSALRRFEMESEVLARLQHPGIAQVLESGVHEVEGSGESLPWFAMELVTGARTLEEYVAQTRLGTTDRLHLFRKICAAVHHGHQKGVIHRDLKPANILVDEVGNPKVIDFGVARSTKADLALTTMHTHAGQLIGTLQYMSPEQCAAEPGDLDLRSDVYALGVVLYELMCGRPPYDVSEVALHEAVRVIQEKPPQTPSSADRRLAGDVETITLKALQKERERRYASVQDLAEDVRRFLEYEPISARPPSAMYQLRKLMQRHRHLAAGILLGAVSLLTGTALAAWQALVARESARDATSAHEESQEQVAALEEVNEFLHDVLVGAAPNKTDGRPISIEEALQRAVAEVEEGGVRAPRVEAQLRYTVGYTLFRRGLAAEAVPHLERAVAAWRQIHGPASPDTVSATNELALALAYSRRGAEAESLLREVLQGRPEEYESAADTEGNLVLVLWREGKWDEAEQRATRLIEDYRQRHGVDGPLSVLNNLALILDSQGRVPESMALMKRVVELNLQTCGPSHPAVLRSRMSYTAMLNEHGHYVEAEQEARDLVERVEEALPDNLGILCSSWGALALSLQGQERFAEGAPWSRKVWQEYRERVGEDDPLTIESLKSHGVFLQKWGRLTEADTHLENALGLAEEHCDPGDPLRYDTRANLGWNRVLMSDLDSAEEFLWQSLEEAREALASDHPAVLRIQALWADLLERQEFLEEAALELEEVHEGRLTRLGEDHHLTLEARHNLARLYSRTARHKEALELYQALLDADERRFGPGHEYTVASLRNVAMSLCHLGRHEEGVPFMEEALARAEGLEGPSGPTVREAREWLANHR